jgi:hypothetical protein
LILPATVTLVCIVFAGSLIGQYRRRPRPYKLAWAAALVMAAVAAGSFVAFVLDPRDAFAFRLYYLFGACLNVGYLGLGSLYLLVRRSMAQTALAALFVLSIVEAALIFTATIDAAHAQIVSDLVLRGNAVPAGLAGQIDAAGKGVLLPGPWLVLVIIIPILGTLALVGGALFSAWRLWRAGGALTDRVAALLLLAGGGVIVAIAGFGVRYGNGAGFWMITAIGWIVLFAGFVGTHRAPAPAAQRAGAASQ